MRLRWGCLWRSILLNHIHFPIVWVPKSQTEALLILLGNFFPPRFVSCAFSTHWMLIKQWLLSYCVGAIQPRAASVAVTQWMPTGLLGKCANFFPKKKTRPHSKMAIKIGLKQHSSWRKVHRQISSV